MTLLSLKFKKRYSVSVFCGASMGNKPAYETTARELGKLIADNNWRLVYGAGGTGLMGAVVDEVIKKNGDIYAVTEKVVASFEAPLKKIKYRTAIHLQQRKREFIDHSDAFVVLPGGIGTLDEFFDVYTGKVVADRSQKLSKGKIYHEDRPIVIINTNGYYNFLVKFLDEIAAKGFMLHNDMNFFKVVKTPKEAVAYLNKIRKAK